MKPSLRPLQIMKKTCTLALATSLFALALFPSGCRRPQAEQVVVTGASTVYPIVQMAAEELRRTKGLNVMGQGEEAPEASKIASRGATVSERWPVTSPRRKRRR